MSRKANPYNEGPPPGTTQFHVPPPEDPPEWNHPAWRSFVAFVELSGVVRKDILDSHSDHWKFAWEVFLGGWVAAGGKVEEPRPKAKRKYNRATR